MLSLVMLLMSLRPRLSRLPQSKSRQRSQSLSSSRLLKSRLLLSPSSSPSLKSLRLSLRQLLSLSSSRLLSRLLKSP
jgi:hypothetical protein